jgi:hypothetical protein
MSDETNENQNEDLKAFEAALGALRPRSDRLNADWRSLLAEEASLTGELASEQFEKQEPAGPLSGHQPKVGRERVRVRAFGLGNTTSCTNPAGHRFLCVHCGSDAAPVRGPGRWAWPAALSTTTALAAILLVMLVTRREPQIAVEGTKQGAVAPASSVVQQQANPAAVEKGQLPGDWLAMESVPRRPQNSGTEEMPYLALRDQVLRDGVESWKSPVSPVVTTMRATEGPLSYREQRDRLLKQEGVRGS